MKTNAIILVFLFLAKLFTAQIALEHVYDSASVQLYMVDLEISGKKYVEVKNKNSNRKINFYNLDHSFWKSIDLQNFPLLSIPSGPAAGPIYKFIPLYISETLFNSDSNIEFIYITQSSNPIHWYSGIYNELGSCILPLDSMGPFVELTVPSFFRPIYNTNLGTKLIMSHQNGNAHVYSISGVLTTDVQKTSETILTNLYPNPNGGHFKIVSGKSGVVQKSVCITDLNGQIVQSYDVLDGQNEINVDLNSLPKGTYFVKIESEKESGIRKVIIQ